MATNWKQLLTDYVDSLEAAIGAVEGGTTLHNKLTAARAAFLDAAISSRAVPGDAMALTVGERLIVQALIINDLTPFAGANIAELAAINIPADVDTLKAAIGAIEGATTLHNKLTAARATLLDRIALLAAGGAGELTLARVGYLDNINQVGLLQVTAGRAGYLDKLPNFEHEVEWSSTPAVDQVANLAATSLTAGSITPTFPAGSTRVRAVLVANIHASNKAANTHNVSLIVQGKKDAGAYGDLINLAAQTSLGMVNLAGAGDGISLSVDVTALVDASASTYLFKFIVDSDNAGAVNYTSSFVLVLVYKI